MSEEDVVMMELTRRELEVLRAALVSHIEYLTDRARDTRPEAEATRALMLKLGSKDEARPVYHTDKER